MQSDLTLRIIFLPLTLPMLFCDLKKDQSRQDQNGVPCVNPKQRSEIEMGGHEERILSHGRNCHKSFQKHKLPWKPAQPCIKSASTRTSAQLLVGLMSFVLLITVARGA